MYLRTFIALQMVQYAINLLLHLLLCVKLYRHDPNKSLIAGMSCLIATLIIIPFYYLPIYRYYNILVYSFTFSFFHTGNKTQDQIGSIALYCLPLILLIYTVWYFVLRGIQTRFPLYNYRESKILCRLIFLNLLAAAAIDLLITRVFVGEASIIHLGHFVRKVFIGVSSFILVYFPALLCMTSKAALRSYLKNDDDDITIPREESLFKAD